MTVRVHDGRRQCDRARGLHARSSQTLSFGAGRDEQDRSRSRSWTTACARATRRYACSCRIRPAAPSLGTYPQAVLTIIDNEIGATVQFGAATYTVAENVVGGVANVTITRTGSTVPGQTVLFSASPGTAVGGIDFTPISNQLVTFSGTRPA